MPEDCIKRLVDNVPRSHCCTFVSWGQHTRKNKAIYTFISKALANQNCWALWQKTLYDWKCSSIMQPDVFLWILSERRRSGTKGEPWLLRTHWAMNVAVGYKGSSEQLRAHQPCTFKQKNICLCREPWRLCWLSQSWRSSASWSTALPVSTADLWPLSTVSLSCTHINSVCVSTVPVAIEMVINGVECCEAVTNKIHIPVTKVKHVMKSSCNLEAIMWVSSGGQECYYPDCFCSVL